MNRAYKGLLAVLTLTLLMGSVAIAKTHGNHEDDAAMAAKASVSIAQAITTAEQQTSGHAIRAVLGDENGTLIYEVEVVKDGNATNVKVDAQTGKSISVKADKYDRDESSTDEEEGQHEGGDREANARHNATPKLGA